MIIDAAIPEQYEIFADKFSLNAWQKGVVGDLFRWQKIIKSVNLTTHPIKMLNMGVSAGHTYLGRTLALKSFPIRTKVYATGSMDLCGYRIITPVHQLIPSNCHELIDILHEVDFAGYHGDPVELVVVDLANQPVRKFQASIETLLGSIPRQTMVLLLHPSTCFSRTPSQDTQPW